MEILPLVLCKGNTSRTGFNNAAANKVTQMDKHRLIRQEAEDMAAAKRLKELWNKAKRQNPGLTQEAAAASLGMNQSAVSHYLNGRNRLNYKAVLAFSQLLGVPPEKIRSDLPEQRLANRVAEPRAEYGEFVDIPIIDAHGARTGHIDPDAKHIRFSSAALIAQQLRYDRLRAFRASDDAMAPRINLGDTVLYDSRDTKPKDGMLYAIDYEGELLVRRADLLEGTLYFKADQAKTNPAWSKPRRAEDPLRRIQVHGRVRWVGSWT